MYELTNAHAKVECNIQERKELYDNADDVKSCACFKDGQTNVVC